MELHLALELLHALQWYERRPKQVLSYTTLQEFLRAEPIWYDSDEKAYRELEHTLSTMTEDLESHLRILGAEARAQAAHVIGPVTAIPYVPEFEWDNFIFSKDSSVLAPVSAYCCVSCRRE